MRSNSRKNVRRGALTGPVTVRVDLNGRGAWEIAMPDKREPTVRQAGGHRRSHAQELSRWLTPTSMENRDRHHRPAMS